MGDKIRKFEDLNVWKESMELVKEIYKVLEKGSDYGFRDQMRKSAVSIPSNISEGFERKSNKEFIQFLYIAKGSCAELRTQIYLASDLRIVNKSTGELLLERTRKISAMLYKLIETRKQKF